MSGSGTNEFWNHKLGHRSAPVIELKEYQCATTTGKRWILMKTNCADESIIGAFSSLSSSVSSVFKSDDIQRGPVIATASRAPLAAAE